MTSSGQPGGGRSDPGDGWRVLSYMIGGMAMYGGAGWLIGHFTHLEFLFPVGLLLGLALSLLMIVLRYSKSS